MDLDLGSSRRPVVPYINGVVLCCKLHWLGVSSSRIVC